MKYCMVIIIVVVAALAGEARGQQQRPPEAPGQQKAQADLPRFDLDFPGGSPKDLAEHIKEEVKIFNVIIPREYEDVEIPPMKMKGVTVSDLFMALGEASRKMIWYETGIMSYAGGAQPVRRSSLQSRSTAYGFRTAGPATPESVWYFYAELPGPNQISNKNCRFYQLGPFLEAYKVEDITTAVKTAWTMLGEENAPELKYHSDTKLLIAVGQPSQMEIIDSVLAELAKGTNIPSPTKKNDKGEEADPAGGQNPAGTKF